MPNDASTVADTELALRSCSSVMSIANDAMFLLNPDGSRFLDVNAAACRMLGYTRDEMLTAGPDILKSGGDAAAANTVRFTDGTQLLVRRKDGKDIPVEIRRGAELQHHAWIMLAIPRGEGEFHDVQRRLIQADEDLARLSLELQSTREEERKCLANKLHNDLGQMLAALRINLSLLQQQFPDPGDCAKMLANMDQLLVSSIASLRRISAELRPKGLADGALHQALETLLQHYGERSGICCRLQAMESELRLDEACSTMIYQIVQDVLTNVLPHAGATTLLLELTRSEAQLHILIGFDGANTDVNGQPSYRLAGLRERVRLAKGSMTIAGTAGAGNRIMIRLPLDA